MLLTTLLLALAAWPAAAQIIDTRSGEELSEQALLERLRASDLVLLGELHDNAAHHTARGQLIARLARKGTTVVAEHLPMDKRVAARRGGGGDDLKRALETAGFNAAGWSWPVHEPLFDAVLGSGIGLVGGNLPGGMSRQLATRGEAALPAALADAVRRSALTPAMLAVLDQDLVDGHCGKLPERYLPMMRLVQRATDASLAVALMQHRPSVLVAGNGHVRKDVGVPQVLRAVEPQLSVTSVAFLERSGEPPDLIKSLSDRYDIVWFTDGVQRSDPCENFQLQ
jgi:uncharacterized iron-regulated protein